MRRLVLASLLVFGFVGPVLAATTPAPRVALVIGNSAYADAPLANPVNDARLMAETLRGLGFDVIERTDATQREMKLAIFELGDRLEAAGKDAVGLFFYAGHGVQVDGQNYLIPLNAEITKERHVAIEAVGAGWVLSQMEFAGNRVNFVILDACRNNPLTRGFRSQLRGLAKMNAPTGSLVAYSTGPGDVAVDGDGVNSPYTLALSRVMQMPGLPAEKVFKLVRDAVREATNDEQTPWEESSMTGADFYFNVNLSVTVGTTGATTTSSTDTEATERLFWQSIQNSTDPGMFDEYLRQFPGGTFVGLARRKRDALLNAEQEETQTAAIVPPPEASIQVEELDATFVALKTSNVRAEPTTESNRVGRLTRDDAVAVTGKVTDKNWYRIEHEGATAYIFGTLITEVDPGELAAWEEVADTSDSADVEGFLKDYPKGHFAERATGLLAVLVPPPAPDPAATSVEPAVGVYPKAYQPGDTFMDCDFCPEMVVVPAGSFRMGDLTGDGQDDEKPVHQVTIPQPFAVGKYEVTRGEFSKFVIETGYDAGTECWSYGVGGWTRQEGWSWRDPKFRQTDRDPVLCVNWKDAQAYLSWLSGLTGSTYRLLSEAEWEFVARAGTETRYWHGDDDNASQLCNYANGAGRETGFSWANEACADGYERTAPVGAFRANSFGLHDINGNVWEWVEDCWHENYAGAPTDGRPWTSGGVCGDRVFRGGSWFNDPGDLRVADRYASVIDGRGIFVGFRVARTLP